MPPSRQPAQRLSAIAGFRLVTADLPGLRQFYREVLGFTMQGPERAIARNELALLGLHGSGLRQVMHLGDQMVSIDCYEDAGHAYPNQGDAASLWFQHLALVVVDMAPAYQRVASSWPISENGPEHLPATSGGVHAFKFRDPDGHPLELLQFQAGSCPPAWQGRSAAAGQIGLGLDHSAISVSDVEASLAFYNALGLAPGKRTLNQGPEQQRLDHLAGVEVEVVPLHPDDGTPHVELLGYHVPRGRAGLPLQPNDVAATRIAWRGANPGLLCDPDGHLQQVIPPDDGSA